MIPADWWIRLREDRRFRRPLRYGFAKHCYGVVENMLEKNRENNIFPSTCAQFTRGLCVSEEGNVFRKREGIDPTSTNECLGIASLFDMEPEAFIPRIEAWLEAAVSKACLKASGNAGAPTCDDVQTFVQYVLRYFQKHRGEDVILGELSVDDNVLQELAKANKCDTDAVRAAVESVLACLGENAQ